MSTRTGRIPPHPTDVHDWSWLEEELPPIVWRAHWDHWADRLGLPLRRGSVANLCSRGDGPRSISDGGRIGFRRADVIAWLDERARRHAS
jgi:hypothetical protein